MNMQLQRRLLLMAGHLSLQNCQRKEVASVWRQPHNARPHLE